MKLYSKYFFATLLMTATGFGLTSCNDFLDLGPQSVVTPEAYFTTSSQLGDYAISQYNSLFAYSSGWSIGSPYLDDNNTDNSMSADPSQSRFTKEQWKTGNSGDLGFGMIRYCNYFFEQVLPKYEAGSFQDAEAKHYIGEMYFIRAWVYFSRLRTYGDYPIITSVPVDKKEDLIKVGKRMPRNEVADFILQDLDKAIALLQDQGFKSNNRINKQVALLVKSRVALYEASFEKYHKGTGRVPGDQGWPGAKVHPNYSFDVDGHIRTLLTTAMEAAKQVADAHPTLTSNTGVLDQTDPKTDPKTPEDQTNPYFDMYGLQDMSGVNEILMWKAYGKAGTTTQLNGIGSFTALGSAYGLLKGYVDSYVMANGLPIYAANSGYHGDETIDNVKKDRDGRLQLFLFGESNWLPMYETSTQAYKFKPVLAAQSQQLRDVTGYRMRKGANFDKSQNTVQASPYGTQGVILFRSVEAYLNYLEAQYMRDGRIDAISDRYWKAIRTRVKVDPDYQKTIAATNMQKEAQGDWGAYSGGHLVDATLYNIRRERRCEFMGEGMRWSDLVRWCALDQLKTHPFQPAGINFWAKTYAIPGFNGQDYNTKVEYVPGPVAENANVSSKDDGTYLLPLRIKENGVFYNQGYTWMEAHYNSPIPILEIKYLSPDESIDKSVYYQTWGWDTKPNEQALQ